VGLYDELVPQLSGTDKALTTQERTGMEKLTQGLVDDLRMDPKAVDALKKMTQEKQDAWKASVDAWEKRKGGTRDDTPEKLAALGQAAIDDPKKIFEYTKAWDDAEKARLAKNPNEPASV